MKDTLSIMRFHIVLISICGAMTFGWLLTGRYLVVVALIGGLDWLLINLANRVSDIQEDMRNAIPGTEKVAGAKWLFIFGVIGLLIGSFVFTIHYFPALTPWRIFIQFLGLIYNFKLIPGKKGWTRLKEVYFLKNFMSGFAFILTCFVYPIAQTGYAPKMGWAAAVALALSFLFFELTYEILYDLRDIEGDRQEQVPTFPVVHGETQTVYIIYGLLIASVAAFLLAFFTGIIGAREVLMIGGPVIQVLVMRPMIKRGVSTDDCIRITHMGSALLVFYLIGTAAWLAVGLPANIFI